MKVRNPISDIRNKSEARSSTRLWDSAVRISVFGILSDFGLRLSALST